MGNAGIYGKRKFIQYVGDIAGVTDALAPIGSSGDNDTITINAIPTFNENVTFSLGAGETVTISGTATTALTISAAVATGIKLSGTFTNAAISMDAGTFANGDHEIQMRNTVSGDKTIIAAGTATDDAGIVTAVGADADIADGSLYMSSTDGGGVLFVKANDTWTALS